MMKIFSFEPERVLQIGLSEADPAYAIQGVSEVMVRPSFFIEEVISSQIDQGVLAKRVRSAGPIHRIGAH